MPEIDWLAASRLLDWHTRPAVGPDHTAEGGVLSLCFNVLDRHVIRGLADEPAVLDGESGDRVLSYAALLERVAQLGGALRELGAGVGSAVVVSLPGRLTTIAAMLACARVGATHVVAAPEEFVDRTDITQPRVVLTTVETALLLDTAFHAPDWIIVDHGEAVPPAPETGGRELALSWLMKPGAFEPAACVEVPADTAVTWLPDGPQAHGTFGVRLAQDYAETGIGARCPVTADLATEDGQIQVYGALLAGATLQL